MDRVEKEIELSIPPSSPLSNMSGGVVGKVKLVITNNDGSSKEG